MNRIERISCSEYALDLCVDLGINKMLKKVFSITFARLCS